MSRIIRAARWRGRCFHGGPSTELRRWYGHAPERFKEFAERYRAELAEPERREAVDHLRDLAAAGPLTLLTATKDPDRSHLPLLAEAVGG